MAEEEKTTKKLVFTLQEAAEIFGVSLPTFRIWVKTGAVPTIPWGGRRVLTQEIIDKVLREGVKLPTEEEIAQAAEVPDMQRTKQDVVQKITKKKAKK